jgi:hypothetical protein
MNLIIKTNKNFKSKTIAATSLFLLIAAGVLLTSIPFASAMDVTTHAWIAVAPDPAQINKPILVTFWVLPLSPTMNDTTTGEHFQNYQVTITSPDGTTETKGPYTPPAIGSTYFIYTPTKLGTYTLAFNYPGQTMGNGNKYLSSTNTATLTVKEQGIAGVEDLPMPTGYWTRPISGETRGWGAISGPWLMTNYDAFPAPFGSQAGYNPYTESPLSSHILWTKQIAVGGIAGGVLGDNSFYPGLSYELRLTPPIIMDGKLYYNLYPAGFAGAAAKNGFACVELRTGEELWRVNDNRVTCGQQIFISDANQLGAFEYVWAMTGTTWTAYNALTGIVEFTIVNATSGKVTFDNTGNMIVYVFSGTPGRQWAGVWNLTKLVPTSFGSYFMWQPTGTYNWPGGMQWNMTLPYNQTFMGSGSQSLLYFNGKQGVATIQTFNGGPAFHIGYDFTGNQIRLLWTQERSFQSIACFGAIGESAYVQLNSADGRIYAYSLTNGQQVWVTDPPASAWGTEPGNPTIADGKLYSPTYDGYVHVYDVANGHELYSFFGAKSSEVPYGQYPFYTGPIIGGDAAYVPTMEHSPSVPLYRGETLYAFNKDTGEFYWNITGYYQTGAIAEGNLILYNAYDGRIYNFGKGPSATTVSAPQTSITVGQSAMITGAITDQSEGQKGTPAISDQDMSNWMEYLYMNHAIPGDAKGVTVTLTATDQNGQTLTIGTTTSDISGNFGLKWTPTTEGTYQITASFSGSNSYGGSFATTYLGVDTAQATITETPTPTQTPAQTQTPAPAVTISASPTVAPTPGTGVSTETLLIASTAVIIIIAVVAAALVLRKRK